MIKVGYPADITSDEELEKLLNNIKESCLSAFRHKNYKGVSFRFAEEMIPADHVQIYCSGCKEFVSKESCYVQPINGFAHKCSENPNRSNKNRISASAYHVDENGYDLSYGRQRVK